MERTIFVTLFMFAFLAGIICLQIFLSARQNKWLGLILPLITFCYAIIAVLSLAAFEGMRSTEIWGMVAATFVISNIPTLILVAIYYACREKRKTRAQLNKMNVQDLE